MSSDHWYLYIIRCSDGSLYTGITKNVSRRWSEHLAVVDGGKKGAKFFRGRAPQVLEFVQGHVGRSKASQQEYKVKSLSHKEKNILIKTKGNAMTHPLYTIDSIQKAYPC